MGYEPCYQNTSISRNQLTHASTLRRWLHQDAMPMNKAEDKLHIFTSTSDYLASRISPTNRNIPALWRVILCLIFFPLASFATQSYDPNARVWLVHTVTNTYFPFTSTPSDIVLPPFKTKRFTGGTPPLNAQTSLTWNPLNDRTYLGELLALSAASASKIQRENIHLET